MEIEIYMNIQYSESILINYPHSIQNFILNE